MQEQCATFFVKHLSKHGYIEEPMHNCYKCDFQSTRSTTLSKHMNMKHRTPQEQQMMYLDALNVNYSSAKNGI